MPAMPSARTRQNNIVLTDDGVSPFHAEIRVEGDQVFISDTGSTNGTFVNGKRIQRRTELRSAPT
jgi:pSer/pThr/pTyr-binding forkhead associated (FHA) protein